MSDVRTDSALARATVYSDAEDTGRLAARLGTFERCDVHRNHGLRIDAGLNLASLDGLLEARLQPPDQNRTCATISQGIGLPSASFTTEYSRHGPEPEDDSKSKLLCTSCVLTFELLPMTSLECAREPGLGHWKVCSIDKLINVLAA